MKDFSDLIRPGMIVSCQLDENERLYTPQHCSLFVLNYELSIRNAFADVDNALVANQKLQEQLAAQVKLVAALTDYSRLARLQYEGGYTGYSTVLQAEQALFPAELTLASIRAQVFGSSVAIYKAMGGGWVALADARTARPQPPAASQPVAQPLF